MLFQQYLDDRMSKKILEQAQEQQDDELLDQAMSTTGTVPGAVPLRSRPKLLPQGDEDDDAAEEDDDMGLADPDAAYQHLAIDEGDERAMQAFMTAEAPQRVTLADLIMAKIKDRQTEIATEVSGGFNDSHLRLLHIWGHIAQRV
jgi:essential nuclear protein 1